MANEVRAPYQTQRLRWWCLNFLIINRFGPTLFWPIFVDTVPTDREPGSTIAIIGAMSAPAPNSPTSSGPAGSNGSGGELITSGLVELGEQIRRARDARNWTRATLAEKADLGESYIGLLERAKGPGGRKVRRDSAPRPSPASVRALATALDADVDRWLRLAGYGIPETVEPAREKPDVVRDLEVAERGHLGQLFSEDRTVVEIPPLAALSIHPKIGDVLPVLGKERPSVDFRIVGVSVRASRNPLPFLFLEKRLSERRARELAEDGAESEAGSKTYAQDALTTKYGGPFSFLDADRFTVENSHPKHMAIGCWGRYTSQTALLLSAVHADGGPWCLLGFRRELKPKRPLHTDELDGRRVPSAGHFSDGLDVLACGNITPQDGKDKDGNDNDLADSIAAWRKNQEGPRPRDVFRIVESNLAEDPERLLLRIYVNYTMGGLYGDLRRERIMGAAVPTYPYAIERDDFRTLTRESTNRLHQGNQQYFEDPSWPLSLLVAPAAPLEGWDMTQEELNESIVRGLLTADATAREYDGWQKKRIAHFQEQTNAERKRDNVGDQLQSTLVGATELEPWVRDPDELAEQLAAILEHGRSLRPDPSGLQSEHGTAPLYVGKTPPKLVEEIRKIIIPGDDKALGLVGNGRSR